MDKITIEHIEACLGAARTTRLRRLRTNITMSAEGKKLCADLATAAIGWLRQEKRTNPKRGTARFVTPQPIDYPRLFKKISDTLTKLHGELQTLTQRQDYLEHVYSIEPDVKPPHTRAAVAAHSDLSRALNKALVAARVLEEAFDGQKAREPRYVSTALGDAGSKIYVNAKPEPAVAVLAQGLAAIWEREGMKASASRGTPLRRFVEKLASLLPQDVCDDGLAEAVNNQIRKRRANRHRS